MTAYLQAVGVLTTVFAWQQAVLAPTPAGTLAWGVVAGLVAAATVNGIVGVLT